MMMTVRHHLSPLLGVSVMIVIAIAVAVAVVAAVAPAATIPKDPEAQKILYMKLLRGYLSSKRYMSWTTMG